MTAPASFTGRSRKRKTKRSVQLADWVARGVISAGGIGTIIAVLGVFAFLAWVVARLFSSAEVSAPRSVAAAWQSQQPLHVAVDDYRVVGWALFADGRLDLFRVDTGERLESRQVVEDATITSLAVSGEITDGLITKKEIALGLSSGQVAVGEIGFDTAYLNFDDVTQETADLEAAIKESQTHLEALRKRIADGPPPAEDEPPLADQVAEQQTLLTERESQLAELQSLAQVQAGQAMPFRGGMVELTPQEQYRVRTLDVAIEATVDAADSAVNALDYLVLRNKIGRTGGVIGFVDEDGKAGVLTLSISPLTDEFQEDKRYEIPFAARSAPPRHLKISGRGDKTYLLWEDGHLMRFDTRGSFRNIQLAEELELTEGDARVTAAQFVLGRTTLLVGDSSGRTQALFPVLPQQKPDTSDGTKLVVAHELPGPGAAVTAIAPSSRNRNVLIGYADGSLRVFYVTVENLLADVQVLDGSPIAAAAFAPKEDALLAVAGGKLWTADFDPKHPEVTFASVIGSVHYEGYEKPDTVWQSGGGAAELETKLGLWPLIYGTLKATFYSLLFGAPLALMAAIYTSEFLHPRLRAKIKPTIEVMASLPSVVLGFLAALVIAPVIDKVLPGTLACFITIPLALLLGAHLWQLLPQDVALRLAKWKFPVMLLCLPLGLCAGLLLGPHVEQWMFAGDIRLWLDGQIGNSIGAWMFLLLPLAALGVMLLSVRYVTPKLRERFGHLNRAAFAELGFLKFLFAAIAVLALAWGVSALLDLGGIDPRCPGFVAQEWPVVGNPSYLGTYDSRNALVVGFMMGFAIIPIIYTIAEDALSTVPDHLRSASLAAGATPWQTVVRIVIPTAMSGLFSALMIGLGRAIGETMIVLMATGNTPIKEWNLFNGFRTLSANIAVELPEAAEGSTHFRTLFLAGLTLFVMTFFINTIAEVVRQRFRRRAYQL